MNKEIKDALKTIKTFLGMEVKLEQMKLIDGNTVIEADSFEPGASVMILVPESEAVPLEVGKYELEDGRLLVVEETGMIASIEEMPKEEAEEEEMPVEADVTPEVTPEAKQPKKVVTITEQHFAEMEAKIAELEAKLSAMTPEVVVEEQPTDVIEFSAEPKPIQFNPENVQPIERVDLAINTPKSLRDRILEEVYNNK
jgi:hypothetical protein